jgi:hypothetical protein
MRATSTIAIDCSLTNLAREQLGLITSSQVVQIGLRPGLLEHRARAGLFVRLFPNVYADVVVQPTSAQQILAGWLAVWDARVPVDVAIAGQSAAILHGFPGFARNRPEKVVLVSVEDRRFRIDGITVLRTKYRPRTDPWMNARITTPAQTVCDLAAVLPVDSLARCMDFVLANRLATVEAVRSLVVRRLRVLPVDGNCLPFSTLGPTVAFSIEVPRSKT